MIYKMTIIASGDDLDPSELSGKISGRFIVKNQYRRTKKESIDSRQLDFGLISFWHPNEFATDNYVSQYEDDIVGFLIDNYLALRNGMAYDFTIFIEIYYDGVQCNFEVFNKSLLKKLSLYEISFPVSVYALNIDELSSWENEINQVWSGNSSK